FETPKWFLLVIAFLLGFSIDIFAHTPGMHSSATVFMAFFRMHLLEVLSPRDGYENETSPSIKDYGSKWFFKYAFILVLLHHVFLFYVEVFTLTNFFLTLGRALLSTIFSVILIMIIQYFYKK
ncbi:MAG: rod shape-determining protein MreD, partial [Bacteroidota bacterium]|nr:rod shape-determining protein MreD [Bacteroidota bacterium]